MVVIVYSLPNCPNCKIAKDFLKEHNIEFEDYDVMENKEKAREMVEKRRSIREDDERKINFPVIDVNGTIIQGFSEEELQRALGLDK